MTALWIVLLCVGVSTLILNTVHYARKPSPLGAVGIIFAVATTVLSVLHFAGVFS